MPFPVSASGLDERAREKPITKVETGIRRKTTSTPTYWWWKLFVFDTWMAELLWSRRCLSNTMVSVRSAAFERERVVLYWKASPQRVVAKPRFMPGQTERTCYTLLCWEEKKEVWSIKLQRTALREPPYITTYYDFFKRAATPMSRSGSSCKDLIAKWQKKNCASLFRTTTKTWRLSLWRMVVILQHGLKFANLSQRGDIRIRTTCLIERWKKSVWNFFDKFTSSSKFFSLARSHVRRSFSNVKIDEIYSSTSRRKKHGIKIFLMDRKKVPENKKFIGDLGNDVFPRMWQRKVKGPDKMQAALPPPKGKRRRCPKNGIRGVGGGGFIT